MRGIHLKKIDERERDLPEYREGAFHIPVGPSDPLLDEVLLQLPEAVRALARDIRSQLEETRDLLKGALAESPTTTKRERDPS